jgi:hypothetical protein
MRVVVAQRAAPTPVFAVVGRNDLDAQHAGPFTRIYAVANHSPTDTTKDPQQTAACLTQIGTIIGQRLAKDYEPTDGLATTRNNYAATRT